MAFSFLDLLFPKRCVSCGRFGSYICRNCFAKIKFIEKPICPVCQRQAVGGKTHPGCKGRYTLDGLIVACRYLGPVKSAISKVKYRGAYDIAKILTDLIVNSLWKFDLPPDLILVPIPLHLRRKKWRGFNQAEILVKILAQETKVPHFVPLIRIAETKTQVGLDKKERRENVKGAFDMKSNVSVAGKNILLVDDVYTSG